MIELKNLTKIFNLGADAKDLRVALDNVNLRINDGEFVTIIGSNGSGKTTTMNLIAGSIVPTSGQILLSGMDIAKIKEFKRAKYFGRVFQDPRMGTTGEMTVLENLEIAYRRGKKHSPIKWGFSNAVVAEYFKSQVKRFGLGLEDRMNQKVGRMSGGQRQALTLLMAANDPRIDTRREFIRMNYDIAAGNLKIKAESNKPFNLSRELKKLKIKCKTTAGEFYDLEKSKYVEKVEKASSNDEKLNALVEFNSVLYKYNDDSNISLLYEHIAALDLKTAKKVLKLTRKIIVAQKLTTYPKINTRREFIRMNYDIAAGNLKIKAELTKSFNLSRELKKLKIKCKTTAGEFYDLEKSKYLEKIEKATSVDEKLNALVEFSSTLHKYNGDSKILLLDEHTAALDPKTAKKVLELTNEIVRAQKLTTLMITHNMKDAITYGDRLIMFHRGHIIHDFSKKEKENLKVDDLLNMFEAADEAADAQQ